MQKKKKNENPAKSAVEKKKEKKLIAIAKLFLLRANKQTKEKQKQHLQSFLRYIAT